MPEYRWDTQTTELARSWNPKLHPRGWGGRWGENTKAPSSGVSVANVKPRTKVYTDADRKQFGVAGSVPAPSRTRRMAGHPGPPRPSREGTHKRPLKAAEVAIPATRRGNPPVPAARQAQLQTVMPSRRVRAGLVAGAKYARGKRAVVGQVSDLRERFAAKRGNKAPKFKKGEFVTIQPGPSDRTIVDRMRRREGKARVGQIISKRPDGKYIVRTADGNRDVHESVSPDRLTVMKVNPDEAPPMRAARPTGMRDNIRRARRVWNAFNE